MENTVAFLAQKVLISYNFSVVSYEQEMRTSLLQTTKVIERKNIMCRDLKVDFVKSWETKIIK